MWSLEEEALLYGPIAPPKVQIQVKMRTKVLLSTIGKFQAEQQKQVQEIQEEVLERAKKAKERAARETMEEQGLVASKPVAITRNPDAVVVASVTSTSTVESKTIMVDVEESSSSSDED
ncbi:unnamed protein product [Arabidopsis thaliana]|uniref:(thale cress) hypothetical protein n=1 Tax=Arabidopsis thaliana TaxID=3702 RepID=A0A7G2EXN5_ARATH|nr:unnamed protein product [Arabidopsis thaliana]